MPLYGTQLHLGHQQEKKGLTQHSGISTSHLIIYPYLLSLNILNASSCAVQSTTVQTRVDPQNNYLKSLVSLGHIKRLNCPQLS